MIELRFEDNDEDGLDVKIDDDTAVFGINGWEVWLTPAQARAMCYQLLDLIPVAPDLVQLEGQMRLIE